MPTKTAEWRFFTFTYKNSTQEVARIKASSYRQAKFLLARRKGKSWVEDALETGLIHLSGTEPADAPVTKAQKKKEHDKRFEALKERGALWYMKD